MNTKKAIDYLKGMQNGSVNQFDYCEKAIDIIIELLKRGEKFEKMWEEYKGKYKTDYIYKSMDSLKQKYFPKEK